MDVNLLHATWDMWHVLMNINSKHNKYYIPKTCVILGG